MGLMDIVEFVEKVCEFSLTDFQKEFVRKVYDAAKNDKRLMFWLMENLNRNSLTSNITGLVVQIKE